MRTAPLADGDWEHVGEGLKTDLAGAFSPEVGLRAPPHDAQPVRL